MVVFEITLGSAVANGGSVTIPYPGSYSVGHFTDRPVVDITIVGGSVVDRSTISFTFAAGGLQITNNTGVTWPAGTGIASTVSLAGLSSTVVSPVSIDERFATDPVMLCLADINFGTPEATSTTYIVNAAAVTGSAPISVTPAVTSLRNARGFTMVSSAAGDTTQTVTIVGATVHGYTVTQTKTLNGTTPVAFDKTIKNVFSITVSAAMAGTLSVGINDRLGLPILWPAKVPDLLENEYVDGATPGNAGALTAGVTTYDKATGGDALGYYTPHSSVTINGSRRYRLVIRSSTFVPGSKTFRGFHNYEKTPLMAPISV